MESLENHLASLFRVNPEVVTDASGIGELDGWDSLSHMNLIADLESRYGIELTGDEIAEMQSVGTIKKILMNKGAKL